MVVAIGDFNAKSDSRYADDITNVKGSKMDILTSSLNFDQIVN